MGGQIIADFISKADNCFRSAMQPLPGSAKLRTDAGRSDDIHLLAAKWNEGAQVKGVVAEAADAFGRLDVVVNHAGYGLVGAFEELGTEQITTLAFSSTARRTTLTSMATVP